MARHVRTLTLCAAAVLMLLWSGTAAAQNQPPLSPPAQAEGMIGEAHVTIDYSRPSKRGRVIFGELVPWGKVWRTGANAATTLTTDRDLVIGGAEVPAGTYTLYTIPSAEGAWKLIINKQTGQWGTQHDAAQDLARMDMQVAQVEEPVEQFTIEVEPDGDAGVLRLTWDTTAATVPIAAR